MTFTKKNDVGKNFEIFFNEQDLGVEVVYSQILKK